MGMAAILDIWPFTFIIIYSTEVKESPYEFEINWPSEFLRKLFQYIDGTPLRQH